MPRVGDYELLATVGRGAYSKVKLCKHVSGEEFVAKILPITKEVETEVRREIAILRRIVHPHVVRLKEILQSSRNYYIILEPVRGGDLCTLIMKDEHENGMPEAQVAYLFEQILAGLMACHNAGVAHRDLKPENLLLTPDGRVKITDFGLSRMSNHDGGASVTAAEFATTLTGTLAYVAPEVLGRHYDPFKADIWSLGCILYVMLTGKFPFGAASGKSLEDLIRRAAWIPLSANVSAEAQDLCKAMLVLDPTKRMTPEIARGHPFLSKFLGAGHEKPPMQALMSESFCESTATFEQVDDVGLASPLGSKKRTMPGTNGSPTSPKSPTSQTVK